MAMGRITGDWVLRLGLVGFLAAASSLEAQVQNCGEPPNPCDLCVSFAGDECEGPGGCDNGNVNNGEDDDDSSSTGDGGNSGSADSWSDPVYLYNGTYYRTAVDLAVDGLGFDFKFKRTYRAKNGPDDRRGLDRSFDPEPISPLGWNWDHSYNIFLVDKGGFPQPDLALHDGSGRIDTFVPSGTQDEWEHFQYFGALRLDTNLNQYFLEMGDGLEYLFEGFSFPETATDGKLLSITDRNGREMSFAYDSAGRLEAVTDTVGREVDFTYFDASNPLVESVTDYAGRSVTYEYYGIDGVAEDNGNFGDLKSVTYAPITRFPNGKAWSYTYYMGSDAHETNLESIIDPKDVTILLNEYYTIDDSDAVSFDAIKRQTVFQSTLGEVFDYAYGPVITRDHPTETSLGQPVERTLKRTIIINRASQVKELRYDLSNRLAEEIHYTGYVDTATDRANLLANLDDLPVELTDPRHPDITIAPRRSSDPVFFLTQHDYNIENKREITMLPNGDLVEDAYPTSGGSSGQRFTAGNRTGATRTARAGATGGVINEAWNFESGFGGGACGCGGSSFANSHTEGEGNSHEFDFDANKNMTEARRGIPNGGGAPLSVENWFYYDGLDGMGQPDPDEVPFLVETFTHAAHGPNAVTDRRVDRYEYFSMVGLPTDPAIDQARRAKLERLIVDDGGENLITEYDYDVFGNVSTVISPDLDVTEYVYDERGLMIESLSPVIISSASPSGFLRYKRLYFYDLNDNLVREDFNIQVPVDATGTPTGASEIGPLLTTMHDYDSLDRRIRTCREVSGTIDPAIDPNHTDTQLTCAGTGAAGHVNLITSADFITTEYQYDGNDNLIAIISGEATRAASFPGEGDADNIVTREFDERDLLFTVARGGISAEASTAQFNYDLNGNLIERIDGAGSGIEQTTTYTYDGHDRLETITDPMGNVTKYTYDANHNRTKTELWGEADDSATTGLQNILLAETEMQYDALNRLAKTRRRIFDPTTGTTTAWAEDSTTYFSNSSTANVTDPESNVTTYAYDTVARLETTTDAEGNTVTYDYDPDSNVEQVTQVDKSDTPANPDEASITRYFYDGLDRLESVHERFLDHTGSEQFNITSYVYDARNNLVQSIDPRGNIVDFIYDGVDRLTITKRLMTDTGDGTGQPLGSSEQDPLRYTTTSQSWDQSSRLISQTDDEENPTRSAYDSLDRVIVTGFADGTVNQVGSGVVSWPSGSANPTFTNWTNGYDVHGNPTTVKDQNRTVVDSVFDDNNRVTSRTVTPDPVIGGDIEGTTAETYKYDGLSRLFHAEDDDTLVTREYDTLSRVIGETSWIDYDGTNGFEADERADVAYEYDLASNLKKTTYPNGRIVQCNFDNLNRMQGITSSPPGNPAGSPIIIGAYGFVGPDRVESFLFGSLAKNEYKYNGVDNGTSALWNADGDFGFRQVRTVTHKDPLGQPFATWTLRWDESQNKTRRELADPRPSPPITPYNESYTYDSVNRLKTSLELGSNKLHNFSMDGVHNRSFASGPFDLGTQTGSYTMNPASGNFEGDDTVNQYSETPWNLLTYDRNGNITVWDSTAAGGTIASMASGGDPTMFAGVTESASRDKTGDPLDINNDGVVDETDKEMMAQLLISQSPGTAPTGAGAQTQAQTMGGEFGEFCPPFCEPPPCPSAPFHVRVAEVFYDYRNQMVRYRSRDNACIEDVDDETRYVYDALGRRVMKIFDVDPISSTNTLIRCRYVNGGQALWQVLEEQAITETSFGSGEWNTSDLATYVYGLYVDEPISMRRDVTDDAGVLLTNPGAGVNSGPEDYYYHHDDLSNVTALSDSTGSPVEHYEYDVYGTPFVFDTNGNQLSSGSAYANPYMFTGRRFDLESRFYYYRTRYYEPAIGRFTTRDTIGIWGDEGNFGSGVAYVRSTPWRWRDPLGLIVPSRPDGFWNTPPQLQPGEIGPPAPTPDLPNPNTKGNCYRYACDDPAKPGEPIRRNPGNSRNPWAGCKERMNDARKDGLQDPDNCDKCPPNTTRVALVNQPDLRRKQRQRYRDYHWFREQPDGTWKHKPGDAPVRHDDNDGNPVLDPNFDLFGPNGIPYSEFCGYLCVPDNGIDID